MRRIVAPAVLLVAAAAAYGNALQGPFVYDDIGSIVENRHIRRLWPLTESMSAPPQATVAGRPLASLSLALNHAAGGLDVRGYHAFNVAVHVLCALLLYGIVRTTLLVPRLAPGLGRDASGVALAVALIWLVHPLCTETVDYVVQRTESIMAAFYLLTLHAAVSARSSRRPWAWNAVAVASCAAGMASKEVMVTAPVAVLLYDLAYRTGSARNALRERLGLYLGLAASWVLLGWLLWEGPRSHTVGLAAGVGALDYARNQCVIVVDYLRTAVWPQPLVFDYGYARPLAPGIAAPYAVLLGLLIAAAGWAYWRRSPAGFPALWIFLVLAPTSSFVPIVSEVGAERRMYLPLMGLVTLVVTAIAARARSRGGSIGLAAGVAVAVLVLGWATARRNQDYSSSVRLWRTAVAARALNPRAHNNLGQALHAEAGMPARAIPHYLRALELDPGYGQAHFNLGVALAALGRSTEAIEHYRLALRADPALDGAHHNLGAELARRGELTPAIEHFREAVRLAPASAGAHHDLGRALRLAGRTAEALEEFGVALRIDATRSDSLGDVAWILATHPERRFREPERAVVLARRAIELAGRRPPLMLDTLAAALAAAGRFDEASAVAREGVEAAAAAGAGDLSRQIAARLRQYERGEPYREPPSAADSGGWP